jgi:hypothetical protein
MASTKKMQNQLLKKDKTDIAIKSWRPFSSTK